MKAVCLSALSVSSLLCASCGYEYLFAVPERSTFLELQQDDNVASVEDGEPPPTMRRVLQDGDHWEYVVYQNVADQDWSWALTGYESQWYSTGVFVPELGETMGVMSDEAYQTEHTSGDVIDWRGETFFTQDPSGLLWIHGWRDGMGPDSVFDPPVSPGRFFRTPEVLEVGAEVHTEVHLQDGSVKRFDNRIAAVEDVYTPIGWLRAFRIERSSSEEWNGRTFRLANSTDWLVPELGNYARSRVYTLEYGDDGRFTSRVYLYELYWTSVELPAEAMRTEGKVVGPKP